MACQASNSTSLRKSIRNGPYEGACMHDGACAAVRSSLLRMARCDTRYVGFRAGPQTRNFPVASWSLSRELHSPWCVSRRSAAQTHHGQSLHFFKPSIGLCAHTGPQWQRQHELARLCDGNIRLLPISLLSTICIWRATCAFPRSSEVHERYKAGSAL